MTKPKTPAKSPAKLPVKAKKQSVHIVTLGCPKNRVDSEVMLGGLLQEGWKLEQRPEKADVIVVNTCAFIEASKKESVDAILEAAKWKEEGRATKLVVAGCLSQRYPDALAKDLPEVDHFLGTSAYADLPRLLASGKKGARQVIPDPDYIHTSATPRINSLPSYTAYLKIAEGCDNECAFCIIPTLRGAQRSRTIEDIVTEAEQLAAEGARELNLVAQDLTAYGHDLPGKPKLHTLLTELGKVRGVRWVRLHYAYPRNFPDELVAAIRDTENVVKYLDMPVQHASDKLLRAMKRGRNAKFLRELLGKLRVEIPGIVLRTSLIVGLPGETDDDFRELMDFIGEQRFERLGIFQFSIEEGTAAATMGGQIAEEVKQARWHEAMALQAGINEAQHAAMVGRELEVLVEGLHEETDLLLQGRHAGQAPEIDGSVILNDLSELEVRPGDLVRVKVTEAHAYDLVGTVTKVLLKAPARLKKSAGGLKLPVMVAPR